MNAAHLSTIVHLATRLQSVGMLHNAALRDFRAGDPIEPIKREAASIAVLTESLAFQVGQLQQTLASEVRRPRLAHDHGAAVLHPAGMSSDSEGGECS